VSRSAVRRAALCLTVTVTACASRPRATAAPADGHAVLARMHDAYDGRWYRTLRFVQRTTAVKPDGSRDTSTWYESIKAPDLLRIDLRAPHVGNGVLYTADSLIVLRNGQVARRIGRGNPFLPLIEGVYVQPLAVTEGQLAPYGFALDRMYRGTWLNRPVYVVGAADASDTTSPQFWVDAERLVLVRMLVAFAPNSPLVDARVDGYVRLAGPSWLATHNEFWSGGHPEQIEDYSDWRIGEDLPDALFDPAQWTTAPHWAPPARR